MRCIDREEIKKGSKAPLFEKQIKELIYSAQEAFNKQTDGSVVLETKT